MLYSDSMPYVGTKLDGHVVVCRSEHIGLTDEEGMAIFEHTAPLDLRLRAHELLVEVGRALWIADPIGGPH